MNRCDGCKHWGTRVEVQNIIGGSQMFPLGSHDCKKLTESELLGEEGSADEGKEPEFWTAPNFGCVLWEAK
jgi:hypothetical protein